MSSDKLDQIGKALALARGEFRKAGLDAQNPHLRNRYATLASVIEACDPALAKHGLTFVQPLETTASGPVLRTVLIHCESGQTIESTCPLIFDQASKINPMQSLGSAITYARRYSLASLLGILSGDDDDGEGAFHRQHQPHHQPAQHAPRPQQSEPEHKPHAGGFWDWCTAAAQGAGITSFQLLNHLVKQMEAAGTKEVVGLVSPKDRIRVCGQFWGDENWRQWFKDEAASYQPNGKA